MTRRDWWIGVLVLAGAILAHGIFPRYEWHEGSGRLNYIKFDRWTGTGALVSYERSDRP